MYHVDKIHIKSRCLCHMVYMVAKKPQNQEKPGDLQFELRNLEF